jgi:hypothetical protein
MTTHTIDLGRFEGPVYTGRDRGERVRDELGLDSVDSASDDVVVKVPEGTYTISSSFFLGLFGPSVIRAGSQEAFRSKYRFQAPAFLTEVMDSYIARALQRRNLFS